MNKFLFFSISVFVLIFTVFSCSKDNITPDNDTVGDDVIASFSNGSYSIEYIRGLDYLRYISTDGSYGNFDLGKTSVPYLINTSTHKDNNNDDIVLACSALDYDIIINNMVQNSSNVISFDISYSDGTEGLSHSLTTNSPLDIEMFKEYINRGPFDLGKELDNLSNISNYRCGGLCVGLATALAVVAVSAYCNNLIAQGTQNCSTGCYTVSACSVDCHPCNPD